MTLRLFRVSLAVAPSVAVALSLVISASPADDGDESVGVGDPELHVLSDEQEPPRFLHLYDGECRITGVRGPYQWTFPSTRAPGFSGVLTACRVPTLTRALADTLCTRRPSFDIGVLGPVEAVQVIVCEIIGKPVPRSGKLVSWMPRAPEAMRNAAAIDTISVDATGILNLDHIDAGRFILQAHFDLPRARKVDYAFQVIVQ